MSIGFTATCQQRHVTKDPVEGHAWISQVFCYISKISAGAGLTPMRGGLWALPFFVEYRILLVEDDPDMLFLLHRYITKNYPHLAVSTFSSAEDALTDIIEKGTGIVITNCGKAEMSGTDLVREMRARGHTTPIFVLSGSPNRKAEALAAGATEFVEKDVDIKITEGRLTAMLKGVLG